MAPTRCVVVNYNGGSGLADCLADLAAQRPGVDIVVVDNASSDDSLAGVPDSVHLIRNAENRGYAAACNQGAEGARGDYLGFVNPDCRLAPDALAVMAAVLDGEPGAAVAGAWVVDPDGGEQRGTRRTLPTPKRALMTFTGLERFSSRWPALAGVNLAGPAPGAPCAVEAVNGACLLVRRARFEALGGFDSGFFLHCEDLDLFKRTREAGGTVRLAPRAAVTHAGGVPSASAPFRTHWHKHAGMARYWRKHYPGHPGRWPGFVGLWVHYGLTLPAVAWRAVTGRRR